MGRKPAEKRNCAICGDAANGINFGAASCLSCKAFFRRNANRKDKQFRCPFSGKCEINHLTRKFCAKCRLKKCVDCGMKKELILNEDEREALKSKIRRNREQKQKEFDEAIRRATEKYQRTESEVGAILHSLSFKNKTSTSTSTSAVVKDTIDEQILSDFIGFFKPQGQQTGTTGSKNPTQQQTGNIEPKTEPKDSCTPVDPLDLDRYLEAFGDQAFECLSDIEQILDFPVSSMPSGSATDYCSENSSSYSFSSSPSPSSIFSSSSSSSSSTNQELVAYNCGPLSKYDLILNFIPFVQAASKSFQVITSSSIAAAAAAASMIPPEIGFPEDELLIPEKYLLNEVHSAGSVLKNPYKRIREFAQLDLGYTGRMTEFILFRLIRMAKQLNGFSSKTKETQGMLLKHGLIEMMVLNSVLMYSEYRDAWAFLDDNYQISVMFPTASIAPYCHKYGFQRHRALPSRFRDEWKEDRIIFDILTALILFTPRPDYEHDHSIQEEYHRYYRLLHRYLRIKYTSPGEADECFYQLMSNVTEVFHLSEDIFEFFKIHQVRFKNNPFFMELLDLPMLSHNFGTADGQSKIEEITTTTPDPANSSAQVLVDPAMGHFNFEQQNNINSGNHITATNYPVEVPQTGIENFWL